MAPRNGKRRRRNPIPVWLPLPRPCLRSLNLPGPPCYMPISPDMYFNPWALPPSCFTKPICQCAHENFCSTSNCQNSTECVKMLPMFCPYGKHAEESDLHENLAQEHHQNSEDEEISTSCDLNGCSFYGNSGIPLHGNLRTWDTKNNCNQRNHAGSDPASKRLRTQGSVTSLPTLEQVKTDNSCQTSFSDLSIKENNVFVKHYKTSSGSTRDYADAESSIDSNLRNADTCKTQNNYTSTEFSCSSCAKPKNSPSLIKPVNTMSGTHNETKRTKRSSTEILPVDQLSDNLSKARKKIAKSGYCISGIERNCKMKTGMEVNTTTRPMTDIHKKSKLSKPSECGCHSTKVGKASPVTHKFSTDRISSTKTSFRETSRFRTISNCDSLCSKKPHKQTSRCNRATECECSNTNIAQKSSEVSELSSPKHLPRPEKISETGTCTDIPPTNHSSTPLSDSKFSKSDTNILCRRKSSDITQPSCQCKFPPAYENLSCSKNIDSCACINDQSK